MTKEEFMKLGLSKGYSKEELQDFIDNPVISKNAALSDDSLEAAAGGVNLAKLAKIIFSAAGAGVAAWKNNQSQK